MVEPRRAQVRPRVFSSTSGDILLLEEEVQRLLDADKWGAIQLSGPAGSGKTTALAHLAAVFPHDSRLALLDNPSLVHLTAAACIGQLVVYTNPTTPTIGHLAQYRLAPWTSDDLIEYLLAGHKDRCPSVMARLPRADHVRLAGVPQLWTIVLDQLAGDESLPDLRSALHRYLETQLPDTDAVERSRSGCLNVLALGGMNAPEAAQELAKPGFPKELLGVLRHEAVQLLLASERIAADLHEGNDCDYLACHLPRELIVAAAEFARNDPRALEHLGRLLGGPP
jgi:energy-coupling factor transporter ATP-binding protein EcfA2